MPEDFFLTGADKKQLTHAVCRDCPRSRQEQLDANAKLIAMSNGKLAAINQQERYLSLGCGHTMAFCKTAQAGGKTPETDLADADGNIDTGKIFKNHQFKEMIEEGWVWQVVPMK